MSSVFDKVQNAKLFVPSLNEVAELLNSKLTEFFEDVQVSVEDCPDLTKAPFGLPAKGICNNGSVLDIGGMSFNVPFYKLNTHLIDLLETSKKLGYKKGHLLGSGALYDENAGNCLLTPNFYFDDVNSIKNNTRCTNVKRDGTMQSFISNTTLSSGMAHAFISNGDKGKVLKIIAKKRIKEDNFTDSLRKILSLNYVDKPMSLGGVFLLQKGTIDVHSSPAEPPEKPIESLTEVMKASPRLLLEAPLTCLSVLNVNDPGLGVNPEHTHCFSDRVDAGHYEFDTTPETVEYEGYFTFAENLYRIGG